MVTEILDSNFEDIVLKSDKLSVVDFWAAWCGPCRMMSPVVDAMADKFADEVNVCKCNVDDCSEVPVNYGIRNIPAILFFKGGEMVDRIVGAVPQTELENKINSLK